VDAKDIPENFKEFTAQHKEKVYSKILENIPNLEPKEYKDIVRVYIDRKGQYRRPAYVLLGSLLYGGTVEEALFPAAVQQLTEDYFLIHDDIMDKNDVRRGAPAAHILYGIEKAILGGDTVHAISWHLAFKASNMLGGSRGKRYLDKFADIMFTTHNGQHYDLTLGSPSKDISNFTLEEYYQSIHAKSAYYSIYGPLQCGAIVANQPDEVLEAIKEYAAPAGLAFQIKDDILDCTSTKEVLGKSIGTDIQSSTKTLILWHAVQNASPSVLNKMRSIYSKPSGSKSEEEVKWVIDTFNELGSIAYAESEAKRLINESVSKFDKLTEAIPESNIKRLARDALGAAAIREK